MIERRESISHMPGLIRNKRNSCPTGRWERERKGMVCQGLCLVAFPNTGLNFPPRRSPANPTLLYEHKRRELTLPVQETQVGTDGLESLMLKVQKPPLEATTAIWVRPRASPLLSGGVFAIERCRLQSGEARECKFGTPLHIP